MIRVKLRNRDDGRRRNFIWYSLQSLSVYFIGSLLARGKAKFSRDVGIWSTLYLYFLEDNLS